jgi:hypothetical protein
MLNGQRLSQIKERRMHEFFKPWIGINYEKTNPKVLVLGESVPIEEAKSDWLIHHINGIIDGEFNDGFQTRIQDIISIPDDYIENGNDYVLEKKIFYDRIVFQEYIQEPLSRTRQRPSREQWDNGKEYFKQLITKYKPDIVLCAGKELYNNLPSDGNEYKKRIKTKSGEMNIWVYDYAKKNTYVCCIAHPSSFGFKKDLWIELYAKFNSTLGDE